MESCLTIALVETRITQVDKLDCELGPPPKPSMEEAPTMQLNLCRHI